MSYLKPTRICVPVILCVIATACGGGGGGGGSSAPSGGVTDTDGDGVVDATDVDRDNDGLIEVFSLEQLDWMRNDLAGASRNDGMGNISSAGCPTSGCTGYELVTDLNFDTNGDGMMTATDAYYDYDGDGSNNGWLPIGDSTNPFAANFDGNDRRIINLFIDRPQTDMETGGRRIGLFGYIRGDTSAVTIRNVRLDGPLTSVSGFSAVGTLAGGIVFEFASTVSNIVVDADVTAGSEAGGIMGFMSGTDNSDSNATGNRVSGTVTATNGNVGGMVGTLAQTVALVDSISDATVAGGGIVGGLVGGIRSSQGGSASVIGCDVSGDVSGERDVGGAIGWVYIDVGPSDVHTISVADCHTSGSVTASANQVGGLIGRARIQQNRGTNAIRVRDSGATGSVSGVNSVGGLIGLTEVIDPSVGSITFSGTYSTATVNGGTGNYVGGLAGLTYHTVFDSSFSSGDVSGGQYVAGLVGDANTGTNIEASYTTSAIAASTTIGIGAFVGWSDGATYSSNHYQIDGSGLPGVGTFHTGTAGSELTGFDLETLQCPTAADDTSCAASTLYSGWGSYLNSDDLPIWDLGEWTELPGLLLDGTIYRNEEVL